MSMVSQPSYILDQVSCVYCFVVFGRGWLGICIAVGKAGMLSEWSVRGSVARPGGDVLVRSLLDCTYQKQSKRLILLCKYRVNGRSGAVSIYSLKWLMCEFCKRKESRHNNYDDTSLQGPKYLAIHKRRLFQDLSKIYDGLSGSESLDLHGTTIVFGCRQKSRGQFHPIPTSARPSGRLDAMAVTALSSSKQ